MRRYGEFIMASFYQPRPRPGFLIDTSNSPMSTRSLDGAYTRRELIAWRTIRVRSMAVMRGSPSRVSLPRTLFSLSLLMLSVSATTLQSMWSVVMPLLLTLRDSLRKRTALQLEILALRHQL